MASGFITYTQSSPKPTIIERLARIIRQLEHEQRPPNPTPGVIVVKGEKK